ncbi:glycosyltransferase [Empedobacter tilapiae]|uniref:Glycosyltransferase n=1 Tax=Empedobacter tilapiae TaxID=2491114 RepID=A0A4Z1B0N3_9FLAO|nr:glycosyltransferase [Empedobacter tilapiae]TGN26653.1 glycosyltransferase [Empedobacter tilapiae]
MPKIAIIIPCYNEEERLNEDNIKHLLQHPSITIYLANDGSLDKTSFIINDIANKNDHCFVIDFDQNQGKANTIYKAIQFISQKEIYDYIGYFDADFSTPAYKMIEMIEALKNSSYEFIFASRIKTLNSRILRKTYRHFIGRIILTLLNLKHHLGIYDTQCGAKIFSKTMIQEVFEQKFYTSWLFDAEVFIRLKNKNLLIYGNEYSIEDWKDVEGSKLKLNHAFIIFKELYLLYTKYN